MTSSATEEIEMDSTGNNNKQIFILSGQSNMAGRGGVTLSHHKKWDKFLPPECQPDPNILRFTAKLHWEVAHEPLHSDIDANKVCGVGPGLAFANSVRAQDPTVGVVGLVPCAVGGTAIKEWERGSHLYQNMVKRAKESVRDGGEIKALLWYQGESDTTSNHLAQIYGAQMERLVSNVRSDLGTPLLPIIQALGLIHLQSTRRTTERQVGVCPERQASTYSENYSTSSSRLPGKVQSIRLLFTRKDQLAPTHTDSSKTLTKRKRPNDPG